MKKTGFGLSVFLCLVFVLAGSVFGQVTGVQLQPFLSGLSSPLFLTHAKDGSGRVFVVQQRGLIKVVQPGSTTATDFINLTSKVSNSGSERGLLGLTFHPQFATNSFFFVNYTRLSDGATVIARYKATNNNTVGDINSEVILLTIAQPFTNHNGGMIEFRNDNGTDNLYIGMGDGGSANDPSNNAQNINSLLGKFLRITPSLAEPAPNPAYTNPPDNPYVGVNGADEIYAIGVRNPFRWSFDRANPSQLWVADVGQNAIEEVDLVTLGGNYGWRVYEGNSCTNNDPGLCIPTNYIPPIFQYSHSGGRCSITGGYVYRGGRGTFPSGTYIYGDYCTGEYWMWNGSQSTLIQDTTRSISSFGEDQNGELYLVGLGGTVDKIVRPKANSDFDGDGKTDISVFRPSGAVWYNINSSNSASVSQQLGSTGDIPVSEDYDGDGRTDFAVFRPSEGNWYYLKSSTNTIQTATFGMNGDTPAAGDYDGDSKADFVVYRPTNGTWYLFKSTTNSASSVQFGLSDDIPTPGDFDGDGKYDIAVYRPSSGVWYRLNSTDNSFYAAQFGISEDIPVQGDYDGDGKNDLAVFRPSTGAWYILRSSNSSFYGFPWGSMGDIPVVGDYDGDFKEDVAVFRPSNGIWYIIRSSNNSFYGVQWGSNGDLPSPRYDAP